MKTKLTPQRAASETRNSIKRFILRYHAKEQHCPFIESVIEFIDRQAKRADGRKGGLGKK